MRNRCSRTLFGRVTGGLRGGIDRRARYSGSVVEVECHLTVFLFRQLPGQDLLYVRGNLAAGLSTTLQEPSHPLAGVDLGLARGAKKEKEHRRQSSAP